MRTASRVNEAGGSDVLLIFFIFIEKKRVFFKGKMEM